MMDDLDSIRRRLTDLEDRWEIANRMASYGPVVDAGLAAETAELWSKDGVYDAEIATFAGRGALEGMVTGELHQSLLAGGGGHFVGVPHIELRGDRATAVTHALLLVQRPEAEDFKVWRVTATRWEWERVGGAWHIVSRVNRKLDGGDGARAIFREFLERPVDLPHEPVR